MVGHGSSFLWVAAVLLLAFSVGNVAGQGCGVSRRRPWRSLSCAEQQAYLDAVQLMKRNGVYDEITRVHQNSGNDNHFVPPFLPFHRWLIWVFEREMQRITGTCITVPYWDWERGSRAQTLSHVLQTRSFGSNNGGGCVSNGIANGWSVAQHGGCLVRQFVNRIGFIRDVEIINRITNLPTFAQFWPNYEAAPHTNVHDYIGGPMEGFWAPDDPLFHLHHSNVDRHYALWQNYHNHDAVPLGQLGGQHYSANLDAPMRIRQGPRVNFNYPGTNRPPTIREVLMIRGGAINVQYVDDTLAQTLQNTDRWFQNNPAWHVPGNAPTRGCGAGGGQGGGQGGGGQGGGGQGGGGGGGGGWQPPPPRPPPNQCQRVGQGCMRNRDCCSGRCRRSTGRCRRRRNGERRRRATGLMENDSTADDQVGVVHLSTPYLEKRWSQLMSIESYRNNPGRIFEVLGKEDCEMRAAATSGNSTAAIDTPTPMDVVTYHANMTEQVVHDAKVYVDGNLTKMFDCHYVIEI